MRFLVLLLLEIFFFRFSLAVVLGPEYASGAPAGLGAKEIRYIHCLARKQLLLTSVRLTAGSLPAERRVEGLG